MKEASVSRVSCKPGDYALRYYYAKNPEENRFRSNGLGAAAAVSNNAQDPAERQEIYPAASPYP
jgi:hypothetical protein